MWYAHAALLVDPGRIESYNISEHLNIKTSNKTNDKQGKSSRSVKSEEYDVRVTVTIPAYLEKQFEQLSDELGLSKQDTFLHCLTNALAWKTAFPEPSVPTARTPDGEDLYMLASPERLRVYTFNDPGSCLRGEEIGEYHEIERGDKYAWVKFSRHSKEGAEGWEMGKNGKLCESCHPIALELWNSHITHF